jgi:predicted amidophosphoribosyltransferase
MPNQLSLSAFADCHRCASFAAGPAASCVACARGSLIRPGPDACPVCAQRRRADGRCPNELCRSGDRRIERIRAISYQTGPLRRAIHNYKYRGTRSLSVVFGRLLLGWLAEAMTADLPGLIVANPSLVGPDGQAFPHTEAVLAAAAAADAGGRWPIDTRSPPAVVKTGLTLRSAAGQAWSKRVSGAELRDVLAVPEPGRTAGQFVLVYDDVCTTGTQLDAVAGCLLDQGGAARVEAVVLARALWRG